MEAKELIRPFIRKIISEAFERAELSNLLNRAGVGHNKVEFIAYGGNGVAFDIGNNKVLKITNHIEEAQTAAWLLEYNFVWIVKIYDVFKIQSDERFPDISGLRFPYWSDTYFIIEERLNTESASKNVSELLQAVMNNFDIKNYRKLGILYYLKQQRIKNLIQKEYSELLNIYNEVFDLLYSLEQYYNLKFLDFQSGNVGRDKNGKLKVFDVYFKGKKAEIRTVKI